MQPAGGESAGDRPNVAQCRPMSPAPHRRTWHIGHHNRPLSAVLQSRSPNLASRASLVGQGIQPWGCHPQRHRRGMAGPEPALQTCNSTPWRGHRDSPYKSRKVPGPLPLYQDPRYSAHRQRRPRNTLFPPPRFMVTNGDQDPYLLYLYTFSNSNLYTNLVTAGHLAQSSLSGRFYQR